MYRFQIIANTTVGETIGLVGANPELGGWDVKKCIRLRTSGERYPLWWTEQEIDLSRHLGGTVEYKYVRFEKDGSVKWEAWGTNRWIPVESVAESHTVVVDDGGFGYVQPQPFGFLEPSPVPVSTVTGNAGLKVVVIGSSVALGYKAWMMQGWSWHLGQALQENYGYQLVNVSESGANVGRTIARFPEVVPQEKPDIVIISLSLGNEGLAYCPAHERQAVQRRFEAGLQRLVKMVQELGAYPILGGVYPNNDYLPEHYQLLQETHQRMLTWGIPVLDWLAAVDDGRGRWKPGVSFDPAHPNTLGHQLMFEAIALHQFPPDKAQLESAKQALQPTQEMQAFFNHAGFQMLTCATRQSLRIVNASANAYRLMTAGAEAQPVLPQSKSLKSGIYLASDTRQGVPSYVVVQENGTVEIQDEFPPHTEQDYFPAFNLLSTDSSKLLFYDGQLGIFKVDDYHLWVINESIHEFNIHPMWQAVRHILKEMPSGVYHDPLHPDAPFRTLMIGKDGLESRVKAPPRSAILFDYQCALSDINRVAIISLGDRCAVRMLLYKMQYDGPAFPFDLTRTTRIADVANMVEVGFYDMWNPAYLQYNPDDGRIYHRKWTGLSFGHEIEDTDNPVSDMTPVHDRMRKRYSARAERFWYTLQHCDKALFIRTGGSDRAGVEDLLSKLEQRCQGKPFRLLLISLQDSEEFAGLPNFLHYNLEFNPDHMYADHGHWMYCTGIMRDILESLGVSSKNLFWCPP